MADDMEEDLFADLYDGDEAANNSKPTTSISAEPVASAPAPAPAQSSVKVEVKEEPGYGEEPDTAAPPDSFDDYAGNNDVQTSQAYNNDAPQYDRPQSTVYAARDEPLQMKEDG